MIIPFLLVLVGFAILIVAGDVLVRGAVNLSLRLGVPALVVSLTIVAFGTSAPEMLIGISAVVDGAPGLALGNVVGSNTANVLLVLGVPAILSSLDPSVSDTRKSLVYMLLGAVLFVSLAYWGEFGAVQGGILLGALAIILMDQIRSAKKEATVDVEGAEEGMPMKRILVLLGIGIVGLPVGAQILVLNSITIAREIGISETAIGLTLVAIGTSLPELATTVMAAIRRQADVAFGNVIGSNLFNLLAITGVASLFGKIPVSPQMWALDIWVMVASTLILVPIVFLNIRMGRRIGLVLTLLYVGYLAWVLG